jgi:thioredoxin 2
MSNQEGGLDFNDNLLFTEAKQLLYLSKKKGAPMSDVIVTCSHCGVKNRIAQPAKDQVAKCGRCHQPLPADNDPNGSGKLTLRCGQCHAKNRVPMAKLHDGARCGRCKAPLQDQDILSGRPVMVTDANFAQTVLQSPLPVLLYSWSPQCGVCTTTGPQVDQLATDTRGKVRVGKLNVTTNPSLANKYNILSVPSFFIFDAGQLKEHIAGALPKHDLMMKMAKLL